MPAYDYHCKQCDHRFEKNQPMSEAPLKVCPECGTESLRKLISPTALVFKGAGFYKNDSRPAAPACGTGTCPMMNN